MACPPYPGQMDYCATGAHSGLVRPYHAFDRLVPMGSAWFSTRIRLAAKRPCIVVVVVPVSSEAYSPVSSYIQANHLRSEKADSRAVVGVACIIAASIHQLSHCLPPAGPAATVRATNALEPRRRVTDTPEHLPHFLGQIAKRFVYLFDPDLDLDLDLVTTAYNRVQHQQRQRYVQTTLSSVRACTCRVTRSYIRGDQFEAIQPSRERRASL